MSRIFTVLCTLLLIVVFTPSTTRADPIVITRGGVAIFQFPSVPVYGLIGNNFSAVGIAPPGSLPVRSLCSPCASGSIISVSAHFAGLNLDGTQIIDFSFIGPLITVPSSLTNLTITSPFEFSGTITGCVMVPCGPVVPTFSVVGSGTARFNLLFTGLNSDGVPIFTFQNITYTFETPEPASMLLLGGGFAALSAGLRRKRRHYDHTS